MIPHLARLQKATEPKQLKTLIRTLRNQTDAANALLAEILRTITPIILTDPTQLVPQLLARIPPNAPAELAPLLAELQAWNAPNWLKPRSDALHYAPTALRHRTQLARDGVTASLVCDDLGIVLALTGGGTILKYSLTTDEPPEVAKVHYNGSQTLARSVDPRYVILFGNGDSLCVWEIEPLRLISKIVVSRGHESVLIEISADGRLIVVGHSFSGHKDGGDIVLYL